jgi:hypothetical protein
MHEAIYALHPWPLHRFQIGVRISQLRTTWKYGNQMGQDLNCMLGGEEAEISLFGSFQWLLLLLYEVKYNHNAKQLCLLSALHSVYCKCILLICKFRKFPERELQMVQLSPTRYSCVAILWVSLMSFAAITLCVASQWVFVVISLWLSPETFGCILLCYVIPFNYFRSYHLFT